MLGRYYKKMLIRNNRGQMMVEAMVAMTIVIFGLLGVFAFLSRSLSLNRVVSNQYVGSNLAAEGIEMVKNLIDRNVILGNVAWNKGLSSNNYEADYKSYRNGLTVYSGRKLNFNETTHYYSYDPGTETPYTREIIITQPSGLTDELIVQSRVRWSSRGGAEFEVVLEDHFYNWRS